jgi:hypothetical protein
VPLSSRGALARLAPHVDHRAQSTDHQRLWADLLSSAALSFNLFGDLATDLAGDRAVRGGRHPAPCATSAAHHRGDSTPLPEPAHAFDVAFVLDVGGGKQQWSSANSTAQQDRAAEPISPRATWRCVNVRACSHRRRRLLEQWTSP